MVALIDTSAAIAALDRADPAHRSVVDAVAVERSAIVMPLATLPEIAFLVARRHGERLAGEAVERLANGPWRIEASEPADLLRAADLMTRYADARLGFVDASVVALAERLGATRIYTLDRRDFGLVRPRHIEAFEILPAVSVAD